MANESRELILNFCTEFIHLISSEANEICNQKNKKTISAEHVLDALNKVNKINYSHYINDLLFNFIFLAGFQRLHKGRSKCSQ